MTAPALSPPSPPSGRSFLGIRLAEGVTPGHVLTLLLVGMIGASVEILVPTMQPLVLTQQLHLSSRFQGQIVGNLALVQNLTMLVLISVFGAMADRFGRRPLLIWAFVGMAVGLGLYAFSGSLVGVVLSSIIIGVSRTSQYAGQGAFVLDYPHETSRGKFIALMMVTQLATSSLLVGGVGAHLPQWLASAGFAPGAGLRLVFCGMAVLALIAAGVAAFGFARRPVVPGAAKTSLPGEARAVARAMREVIAYARKAPRYRYVLFMSCALRGDIVLVTTFLSLWIMTAGRARGIEPALALKSAGVMLIALQAGVLVGSLTMAALADRLNRNLLMTIALGGAAVAFSSPALVHDVFGWQGAATALAMGLSEGATIICVQSLLGQETPAHLRGASAAGFTVFGMLGAMAINYLGGVLFDSLSPVAPFVMVGLLNLVFVVWSLISRKSLTSRPV